MIISVGPAVDDRRSVVFVAMHQIGRRSKTFKVTHYYHYYTIFYFSVMLSLKLGADFVSVCVELNKNLYWPNRSIILSALRIEKHVAVEKKKKNGSICIT